MKAVQISRHGQPMDVLELVDIPEPGPPGPGEVLLEMLYSPINPFDLRIMRGVVPGPALPSILGSEGVARVLSRGADVNHVAPGDTVHLPSGYFGWRERLVVPAASLFPLPGSGDLHQYAMMRVNPPTAALLLSEFVDLRPGDWVVQDAANSAVGRGVIAFAKARGLRTVNVVRREEAIDDVRAAGGDVALVAGDGLKAQVELATGNAQIKLGLEGVGGPSLAMISGLVGPGATVVVYSAMSEAPGVANQLDILFRDVSIRGFWLAYPRLHTSGAFGRALRETVNLIEDGKLRVPAAATYPLERLHDAIAPAGRGPKVLLKLT